MTIPETTMERTEKLTRLQDRMEAAQDAAGEEINPWLAQRAQERASVLQRRVAVLYRSNR